MDSSRNDVPSFNAWVTEKEKELEPKPLLPEPPKKKLGRPFAPGNKAAAYAGGQRARWTLTVLEKMARHYPEAIERIADIVRTPLHKDHFAACRFVCETLVSQNSTSKSPERGELRITIELAADARPKALLDAETIEIAQKGSDHEEVEAEAA